ncbi:putative origin recognition complex subunit [Clavispora lusitaniae]|uniref:Origin recognition complex subunit 4 n=1 Tax=Clavispora lusitaniae TaxID=36911 RepID=A0AA91T394_CLALS|nr:putative origin recognition complex subunit [Clavispora lusitaniae]
MSCTMSQFKDFEGEFCPVKQYSIEELKSDKFLKRLKLEKRLHKSEHPQSQNQTPKTQNPLPKRKHKISLLGTDQLKEKLKSLSPSPLSEHSAKKRKVPMLLGTEYFRNLPHAKESSKTPKPKPKIALTGTDELRRLLEEKSTKNSPDASSQLQVPDSLQHTSPGSSLQPGQAVLNSSSQETSGPRQLSKSEIVFSSETNESQSKKHSHMENQAQEVQESRDIRATESSESGDTKKRSADEALHSTPVSFHDDNELNGSMDAENENPNNDALDSSTQNNNGGFAHSNNFNNSTNNRTGDSTTNGVHKSDEEGAFSVSVEQSDVDLMRRTIMSQLTGKKFPQLENSSLWAPYDQIHSIMEHTIRDFEGHSTLLIGPRGSGKSLILDKALDSLRAKYRDSFITIKLNACLHSDDKIALREIARQLDMNSNKFGAVTGETTTFEQRAISDTFTNILLTLDSNAPGRKYDETNEHPTPIVIIIEEIEKFTSNAKQTLLYNIFDLSQSSKIPIAVIGVSTMITTRELLEKRVRSRFSQRIIDITKATTIEEFWRNAKLNLTVAPQNFHHFTNKEYPALWNNCIEGFYKRPSILKKILYKVFYTTKNYKDVNVSCVLPVSKISIAQPFPLENLFETYMQNMSPNHVQSIVGALSNLELLLVIAAARWIERVEVPHVNFNLAYAEYTEMMKTFNREATTLSSNSSHIDSTVLASIKVSQRIWSPKVLRDCWANLYKMGILFDVITSNNEVNGNNNYNMYKETVIEDSKMLQLDASLDDLASLIDDSVSFKKLTRL